LVKEVGLGLGRKGQAGDLRTKFTEPQSQPAALETGVPCHEASSVPPKC
jgi:hypothetical protein